MKLFKHIGIFLVAALLACSCSLSKVKDIAIKQVGVAYIVPTSPRSVDAKLQLEIDNPSRSFSVREISGTILYQEKPIAHFITGPLELQGKTTASYELPCTVNLADGASLLEILMIAGKGSLDGLKADVDIQAALKKNGVIQKPLHFKGLDISQFKQP